MKRTKTIRERHLGQIIGHNEVEAIPEGLRLMCTRVRIDGDWCLRTVAYDDKDRSYDLGAYGDMFDLTPLPLKYRAQVYQAVVRFAVLLDLA
jgi:hypothetical protein